MRIASICPIQADGDKLLNIRWFDTVKMLDHGSEVDSPSFPSAWLNVGESPTLL